MRRIGQSVRGVRGGGGREGQSFGSRVPARVRVVDGSGAGIVEVDFDDTGSGTINTTDARRFSIAYGLDFAAPVASASASTVTGTTVGLTGSASGSTYSSGDLTYDWTVSSAPSGAPAPTFSANGTNAAASSTATFGAAGAYAFQVTVTDPSGQSSTSSVDVTVDQTLASISVTPGTATVGLAGTQQFTATALDQFGGALASQPAFTWSNTGAGSVSSSGFYTAPASYGSDTVTAANESVSGSAAVTIAIPAPTDLTATAASTSEIDLSWTDVDPTLGVLVQRSSDGGDNWQTLTTTPLAAGTASYADTGLSEGTGYAYQVLAVASGADSEPSDTALADTLPLAPSGLSGSEDSSGEVDLTWTDNSANAGSDEILTSSDGVNFGLDDSVAASGAGNGDTYTDSAPTYGQTEYYEVEAAAGDSESAPSNVFSITPVAPPTANGDSYTVVHGQTLSVGAAAGVLANDTGSPGDTLTVAGAGGTGQPAAHGIVTLNSDGSFEYTPNAGFVGTDTFSYSATDGSLVSQPATVTINVTDQAPQASSNSATTVNSNPTNPSSAAMPVVAVPGSLSGFAATDPDGDNLTYSLVNADGSPLSDGSGNPTPLGPYDTGHGTAQLDSSGDYTYTPAAGFVGMDRFYYVASDGIMNSNVASISINVQAGVPILTDPDIAVSDSQSTDLVPGGPTSQTYSVLLGGSNLQNVDASQLDVLTAPHLGTISPPAGTNPVTQSVVYTPGGDGLDTFTYGFGRDVPSTTALLDVSTGYSYTWGGLGGQTYTVSHGDVLNQTAAGGLLTGVQHPQGGTLSVNLLSGPASGTLTLGTNSSGVADGSFAYTPASNATGWVYFSYDVQSTDGTVSPPATAAINVADALPLVPHANDYIWTYQNQAQNLDLRLENVDAEHPLNTLTASIVSGMGPQHGTLTANGDGTYTYVPDEGYTGPDDFTYQVSDGVTTSTHGVESQSDDVNGNYETVFINVQPLPVSLSIAGYAPGDPSATVVLDPTAASTTELNLNMPTNLPAGTQVTLKLTDQQPTDTSTIGGAGQPEDVVQVFDPTAPGDDPDGQPPGPNGPLVLGSSATESAGDSVTWTVAPGNHVPTEILVSGNTSGTLTFELDVTPGDNNDPADGDTPSVFGNICLAGPATGPTQPAPMPQSRPTTQSQPATTQAVSGWTRDDWDGLGHSATAGSDDTLGTLAALITGSPSDWNLVHVNGITGPDQPVPAGTVVDVTPLFDRLESILRKNIVARASAVGFGFGTTGPSGGVPDENVLDASDLADAFAGKGPAVNGITCIGAANVIMSMGLIDTIGASTYDNLKFYPLMLRQGYMTVDKRVAQPGDWVAFDNPDGYYQRHPAGAFWEENSIVVAADANGPTQFFGNGVGGNHPVDQPTMYQAMIDNYNSPPDPGAKAPIPGPITKLPPGSGLQPFARFFNVPKLAATLFDYRSAPH